MMDTKNPSEIQMDPLSEDLNITNEDSSYTKGGRPSKRAGRIDVQSVNDRNANKDFISDAEMSMMENSTHQ